MLEELIETIIINPKKIKRGAKMARRRKVHTITKRVFRRENLPKMILTATAGFWAVGVLAKSFKIAGKGYIAPILITAATAMLGRKYLKSYAAPVIIGMGLAATTAFISQTPQLSGLLSDVNCPGQGLRAVR